MSEIIREGYRTAKKEHVCDYCLNPIKPGERYLYSVLRYDNFYAWKSHERCRAIADALYAYIDPPDCGIGSDEFHEGCTAFCEEFLCDSCKECSGVAEKKAPCYGKISETLKTHRLRRDAKERWRFRLVEVEHE